MNHVGEYDRRSTLQYFVVPYFFTKMKLNQTTKYI
jgi:hypothetical protein